MIKKKLIEGVVINEYEGLIKKLGDTFYPCRPVMTSLAIKSTNVFTKHTNTNCTCYVLLSMYFNTC